MKATVTPEVETAIADIARRHGLSREAVLSMLWAIHVGGGTMAQFSIPELGGSGQWMQGGMTMVGGNMFDNALKARVDALCGELAQLLASNPAVFPASANWWPANLGVPSSVGGQNAVRYAIFPSTRRLAIQINGVTKVFDTGEHHIGGVQQQQQGGGGVQQQQQGGGGVQQQQPGGAYGSVTFTSQFGTFDVWSLPEVGTHRVTETPAAAPAPHHQSQYQSQPAAQSAPQMSAPQFAPQTQAPEPASGASRDDSAAIVAAIESLAGLHERGILSDEEFAAKKAELLGRL
jgi:Short C-terminal domain